MNLTHNIRDDRVTCQWQKDPSPGLLAKGPQMYDRTITAPDILISPVSMFCPTDASCLHHGASNNPAFASSRKSLAGIVRQGEHIGRSSKAAPSWNKR